MRKSIIHLFVLLIFHSASSQNKTNNIKTLMQQYHNYNMFDGAILVAEDNKILYQGAFGLANREWNISNTTDTKFMIGSISKPLTATLTLIQVQKGLIALNKTIADYLPELKNKPSANVTIKELLSHTSGMPNYDIIKDFFPRISRQHFTREDYLKVFIDSALAFAPSTQYAYSSWGYFTLGYLLEKVTGKTYAQLMKDDIFSKLDMRNTGSYEHTQIVPNRATGYDYSFGGYTSSDFRDQSNTMGTGDVYATVGDMFKFHVALSKNSILNKTLTEEMFTPGRRPARYGYGWFNQNFKYTDTDSITANYHLGSTDGFISLMLRIPATNSLVIILCNSYPTDFFGITKNVIRILQNKPILLKEPLHKKIEKSIATLGATKAVAEYNTLKKDTAHYYTDWISMTFLAEQLLKLKRFDDARIISENNVIDFPDRDFVMLTMGNIYLALGRNSEAKLYFEKTLKITPNYEEAKNRLKEIK
jgi:CubicO group peptidase (beta-lactamase class C family)